VVVPPVITELIRISPVSSMPCGRGPASVPPPGTEAGAALPLAATSVKVDGAVQSHVSRDGETIAEKATLPLLLRNTLAPPIPVKLPPPGAGSPPATTFWKPLTEPTKNAPTDTPPVCWIRQ